ncbi:putative membrane transporter [Arabidopsis thaliana]|uniref:ABC transporter G family member 4 n=1 Tax=Arabidopsis thaliana TaxID=3702 RepID=AB4G_ARATH|nr:ABC-2 type transporter family protein [Arabidopsis thaliana]Q9SW08.1 RecName: Full=ABC transporter G family member 4; Short=ABC transporter ABCG.4; Short=AtABCG4; AltName: Full=White-brown complex homolog protein 4; Short=AtWBC4 [Arabidopsis thaliana]AEE85109.1 ABC-2 type transporter family protein [Arabidopsis thaliana]CAB39596.1 putative membrane transporter [Arabidopsis thaliana]CAB81385.1 putative membrane transporter [Arabidopsis thaliana]|eukprot:NP_194305.1 ABC-2 type transporter family protein [Arabidopsis thaliana]
MESYTLSTSSISYAKPLSPLLLTAEQPSFILRNITLTSHPSQILAIIGPSGAGKSTLLDILAARTSPTSGSILLNSVLINPSSYRKISSYVPQHDTFFPLLTVSETFTFSASLLLPKNLSKVSSVVASLLKELNLTHLAHTRLGQGLSGGERRRVSIGLSLLHDPEVLLLDEPTSGLDSKSAFDVVQILKSIATSRERIVILSIHQPSFKILSLIDRVLLLSKGTIVYHGRLDLLEAFLLSKGFTVPSQLNSLEYAMEILQNIRDPYENANIALPDHCPESKKQNQKQSIVRYKSSRITEISLLSSRFWKIIYRTRQLLLTNILESLVVGLVLGTIYLNIGTGKEGIRKRFGLFAFTLTFLLSSTTQTLPIFIDERPILLRETSSGLYRLSSHILANTLVFLPYLLLIAIIYSVSLYFLVGLCFSWQALAYFVLVIWIIVLMANSFVLFLSSLAPNYIAGTSSVTILLAAFFLFSGYFISKESLPKYWLFMYFFSMYKYALDALLINEYSCLHNKCLVWFEEASVNSCLVTGGDVLDKNGLHERQRWFNVYMLLGFFVLYRVLCFLVLLKRVSGSKR